MSALGLSVLVHLQYKKREYVDHTAGKQLEVSVSVDVGTSPGGTVLPADVGVDVSTWVVSVLLLTVQVYTEYVNWYIYTKQATAHSADCTCVNHFHCWLLTDVGSTDCPHLHSVELT